MELSEVQADGNEGANQLTKKVSHRKTNQERNNNQPKLQLLWLSTCFGKEIRVLHMERNVRNGILSRPVATRNEKGQNETNS